MPDEIETPRLLPDRAFLALAMVAKFYEIPMDLDQVSDEFFEPEQELTYDTILRAALSLQLKGRIVQRDNKKIMQSLPLPAIVKLHDGRYVVLVKIDEQDVLFQDPYENQMHTMTLDAWLRLSIGNYLLLAPDATRFKKPARFDLNWFIPVVMKYRRILAEIVFVSLIIQLLALATPLFFQAIMDKVLAHRAMNTLDVLALGLMCVIFFEVGLTLLRSYLLSHTTSRIDVELGAQLFRHLIQLPIRYFHSRRAGELVNQMQAVERVREFITGHATTTLLDMIFAFIFIGVMWYYSGWLTLIVLISLPCYWLLTLTVTPFLRAKVQQTSQGYADNQAFLIETIHGIETVKALAVNPQMIRRWDTQLAAYISARFRVSVLANWASQAVLLIQKIVVVATLWLGAKLVMGGEITLGALIAFNMLAGRIAAPVMKMAQLWHDFQQMKMAVECLADIFDAPTERQPNHTVLPGIRGKIQFQNIGFQYCPDALPILKDISLHINEGEVVGIVGRSGSGKSTLVKLLQKLYLPQQGRILLDDIDLRIAEPNWLRRQLGVVQQDDFLFHGSIRDNIAVRNAVLPLTQVIHAAKLAGAHEFIMDLPNGYDTLLGEQGKDLSGGQKQRIAIARALINAPRILIFDEATSALDYESERMIQRNMAKIAQGRTVLIIAHRLSVVRKADRIIVLEKGEIVEQGSHQSLLNRTNGIYRYLYRLQQGEDAE